MKLNLSNNKTRENSNVQTAQVINPVSTAAAPAIEDADAVEITDEPEQARPEVKKPVTLKRKDTIKKKDTKGSGTSVSFTIQEYVTKKGGTAYLLFGFGSKDAAETIAGQCSKTVSASWRTGEDGEKRYCLSFGTRYGDVARAMCAALNSGDMKAVAKAAKDSCKVYDKAVADGKAAREQAKQERAEAKAVKAAEKAPDPAPAAKTYTDADVASMLRDIMAGKAIPANVKKLMKAA